MCIALSRGSTIPAELLLLSVRFSSILPEGSLLHSVEPEPMGHSVGMALLRFAGLADRVVAEFDFSGNVMKRFASEGRKIDFLFIDHGKKLLRDLGC